MKIIQVLTYSVFGGMSLHVLTLSKALKERGHDVEVLSMCDGPLIPEFERAGIPVTVVPYLEQKMKKSPWSVVRAIRFTSHFIRERDADVVHTHGPRAHFLGGCAARLSGRRVLVASVHGSFTQFTAGQDAEMSRLKQRIKGFQYGGIDRLTARVADKMIAVCPATERDLLTQLKIPADRVVVVSNGIEEQLFTAGQLEDLRRSFGYNADCKVVAYVGRIAYHKGSHDLMEAMEMVALSVPEARFLIVGEGPMMGELKMRCEKQPLSGKVIFTGVRKDAVALIAAADLLVLPSLSEGPSLTLVEAAMIGRAAIATDVGGMPEVVMNGTTGLLVPPKNPGRLAEAIQRLLNDDEARIEMSKAARRMWLHSSFSADQMTNSMEKLYGELAAAKTVR